VQEEIGRAGALLSMAPSRRRHSNSIARRLIQRDPRALLSDRSGAQAVEFALIAPLLLTLIMGIIQFSITLNNYIELTEGVRTGARNLAISRAMASATPYTSTVSDISASAGNLTAGSISVTVNVNGTACTTDSGCSTALSTAAGQTASVSATYPCNLQVMGVNFLSGCTLRSQTSDLVE
jgi:Flp pilus assembly protein TadG